MAKNLPSNSHLPSSRNHDIVCIAKPSSEFYSVFSQEEVFSIIYALKTRREIPLKYSYKGKGAKIWDNFYLKYIIPTWYRKSNVEIDLLKNNLAYIDGSSQPAKKINIIDVGAGNSYPVKAFINHLNKLSKINRYIALDISEYLLHVSRKNFQKWFPLIDFTSHIIDIENSSILPNILEPQNDNVANIFLHLGVTIANHQNRNKVFKNFRDSMGKHDLLVFTNEIGFSAEWDGIARGGCKYHADEVYRWIKQSMGIKNEDCELIRKYDLATDSIVANIKFRHNHKMDFSYLGIDNNIDITANEEITIWRHHKFQISEILQEIKQAGLKLVHYSKDKYSSHLMVICEVDDEFDRS